MLEVENNHLHEDKVNILSKLKSMAEEKRNLEDLLKQGKCTSETSQRKGEALMELFDREQRFSSAIAKKLNEVEEKLRNIEVSNSTRSGVGTLDSQEQDQQVGKETMQ